MDTILCIWFYLDGIYYIFAEAGRENNYVTETDYGSV